MPDTQICRHCKNLWPAALLFSVDGACPRCQANRPAAKLENLWDCFGVPGCSCEEWTAGCECHCHDTFGSRLRIDEFSAEASVRMAIEDTEAELVRLRAILATYLARGQELRNHEGTVVGVQWEGDILREHMQGGPYSPRPSKTHEEIGEGDGVTDDTAAVRRVLGLGPCPDCGCAGAPDHPGDDCPCFGGQACQH